jgi:hypothetical protein
VPLVCHLAAGHAFLGLSAARAPLCQIEKSLQGGLFKLWPPAQESHGDRTPSFAVMRYRAKMPNSEDAVLQVLPHQRSRRGDSNPGPHHYEVLSATWSGRMVEPDLPYESAACATGVQSCSTRRMPAGCHPTPTLRPSRTISLSTNCGLQQGAGQDYLEASDPRGFVDRSLTRLRHHEAAREPGEDQPGAGRGGIEVRVRHLSSAAEARLATPPQSRFSRSTPSLRQTNDASRS